MKGKIFFFLLAVAVSMAAALLRPGDSAHSIGLMKVDGGKVRHESSFPSGKSRYILISTATVIPPYRGDVRVALEGAPAIDYSIYMSGPVINLGLGRFPEFRDNTIFGLMPMDRIALWVEMHPPKVDPVCDMAHDEGFLEYSYEGREYAFCSQMCLTEFMKHPEQYAGNDGVRGLYHLAFYDTKTDRQVMSVPVKFLGKGEKAHGGGHHH